mgnify:CR=1 FL=1
MANAKDIAQISNTVTTPPERTGLIAGGIAQAADLGLWSAKFLREEYCPADFVGLNELGFTVEHTPEHTYVRWNNA